MTYFAASYFLLQDAASKAICLFEVESNTLFNGKTVRGCNFRATKTNAETA